MKCPQCGTETPDEEWNCVSCRMNVYWASQHYDDLAGIRQRQGLRATASTPPFLVQAHECAMGERAERGGKAEHKVRQIARRVMRQQADDPANIPTGAHGGSRADVDPGWKQREMESPHPAEARVPRQPVEAT
jgi:hypothetical protein